MYCVAFYGDNVPRSDNSEKERTRPPSTSFLEGGPEGHGAAVAADEIIVGDGRRHVILTMRHWFMKPIVGSRPLVALGSGMDAEFRAGRARHHRAWCVPPAS
jgi:hypothetical protein